MGSYNMDVSALGKGLKVDLLAEGNTCGPSRTTRSVIAWMHDAPVEKLGSPPGFFYGNLVLVWVWVKIEPP